MSKNEVEKVFELKEEIAKLLYNQKSSINLAAIGSLYIDLLFGYVINNVYNIDDILYSMDKVNDEGKLAIKRRFEEMNQ